VQEEISERKREVRELVLKVKPKARGKLRKNWVSNLVWVRDRKHNKKKGEGYMTDIDGESPPSQRAGVGSIQGDHEKQEGRRKWGGGKWS